MALSKFCCAWGTDLKLASPAFILGFTTTFCITEDGIIVHKLLSQFCFRNSSG